MTTSLEKRFIVHYQSPYGDCEWREHPFDDQRKATAMAEFYASCMVPVRTSFPGRFYRQGLDRD